MTDEERFKLLVGRYEPPRTRRGKFLFCEARGTVKTRYALPGRFSLGAPQSEPLIDDSNIEIDDEAA